MGKELTERMVSLVSEHGIYSDSFLMAETDRSYFWSPGHSGVIGYVRYGRHFKVVGGIAAPVGMRADLLGAFLGFVRSERGTAGFLNIGDTDLPLFETEGFRITKWGEEAVLDLPDRTWRGKEFERMRQQVNYGRRNGLTVSEIPAGGDDARLHAELLEIEELAIGRKSQSEGTRVMQAQLHPERADGQRIFVARAEGGKGRTEAFIVCLPGKGGKLWSAEIYRHRPDCVRNALVFLIHDAGNILKAEGAQHLTLGLLPAIRCAEVRPGDSPFIRHGIRFAWERLGFIIDLKGVFAFKNRFRPRYENRYVCSWPDQLFPIGSTLAFLKLWGGGKLDLPRTLKHFYRQKILRRRERKSLVNGKRV